MKRRGQSHTQNHTHTLTSLVHTRPQALSFDHTLPTRLHRTALTSLNLAFNLIESIAGLAALGTDAHSLEVLDLRGNRIAQLRELSHFSGLTRLKQLRLGGTASPNPVCQHESWRVTLFNTVRSLEAIDGADRAGRPGDFSSETPIVSAI